MNGGALIAATLARHEVRTVFTLCGGHISPILVEAKRAGLRVVDTRHEVSAVFAADATARLTGRPGVAAVTAGPGVTNTITAIKNAQMAQSPVVLLGGATATVLEGRGSLQDIDQMSLLRPHVKWLTSARRLRDLGPALEEALEACREGVPGPVFLECPVDLLYEQSVVREWYGIKRGGGLRGRLLDFYLERHLRGLFRGDARVAEGEPKAPRSPQPRGRLVRRAAGWLTACRRPVLLVGSQAMLEPQCSERIAASIGRLGVPTYLSGMARGLLGRNHPLQMRHKRREALRQADLIVLAGVPCDFRLDYGRQFGRGARVIAANRSRHDLGLNRRPDLASLSDAGRFLCNLEEAMDGVSRPDGWTQWLESLRLRGREREDEIDERAGASGEGVNPLRLFRVLDSVLDNDAVLVADGGDFVGTSSYTLSPRKPLSWLDPGVFGTLGVGAGFALGAKLCRPDAEVWIIYGDGSAAYSLAEFDTFVRHRLPVIALVGNDASWAQIAREQVPVLGDDVATKLRRTDYDVVAEGYGGRGLVIHDDQEILTTLERARRIAAAGQPVLINAHLAASDFRKGSLSM